MREVYRADTAEQGRARGAAILPALLTCPIPEVARSSRVLRTWRVEWLGYFDTAGGDGCPRVEDTGRTRWAAERVPACGLTPPTCQGWRSQGATVARSVVGPGGGAMARSKLVRNG